MTKTTTQKQLYSPHLLAKGAAEKHIALHKNNGGFLLITALLMLPLVAAPEKAQNIGYSMLCVSSLINLQRQRNNLSKLKSTFNNAMHSIDEKAKPKLQNLFNRINQDPFFSKEYYFKKNFDQLFFYSYGLFLASQGHTVGALMVAATANVQQLKHTRNIIDSAIDTVKNLASMKSGSPSP